MAEKVVFANLCMIQDGSRVVVLERKGCDWPGITFPGGHVEEGESFTEAVIREIKEETGLTIRSPRICGIKNWHEDDQRAVVLLYKTSQFEGTLQSSEEGEVWWEEIDNLPNLNLAYDMEDLLRVFTDDNLSEFLYRQTENGWQKELK